ncbi:MAG: mitochondrial fission ELM1 family protein [Candidatus Omnitrophica bacterium]|nr:mitochondrial fission ELM1 family protein [Candidatus Omnitrophota bacterium]
MAKMNSFQGSIACFILKGFAGLVSAIPLGAALFLGRRMGELASMLGPRQRHYALEHLKIAFGKKRSYDEIKAILRKFYHSYGQSIVEIARLPLTARMGSDSIVEVTGRQYLDEAMKKGRGCIFLSIHSGNWELSNLVGSMSGYPYNMVANDLNHVNKVADFLNGLRRSAGCRIIHPGIGGREIIKRLKNNEIVTLVADQGGAEGVLVPFFGRKASMSTGAVRLAMKYNVPIVLVNIHRVDKARHKLEAIPFEITQTDHLEQDVEDNLRRMARQYEAWIEEHPQEYVWPYKTWKRAKDRVALILDDGRVGHLRQSQSVARAYAAAAKEKGYAVTFETVGVKFRSDIAVRSLAFLVRAMPFFFGRVDVLRNFLDPDSFDSLARIHADVVISCGARNTAVNYCLGKGLRARSIAVLPNRILSPGSFDLVVMPQHDLGGKGPAKNAVVTQAALNLMDKEYLEDNVKLLFLKYQHLKHNVRFKMAVMIGGDTKDLLMSRQDMKVVLHQIRSAAEELGIDLLITTSRRTPPAVEQLVIQTFDDHPRTALLLIANKTNVPEAVGGMLGLADMVLVSGESISMVSEAASSGKRTIVFPIGSEKNNKYVRFCESLASQGYIIYASPKGVTSAIDNVIRNKIKTKPINDNAILTDAIRKII